MSPAVVRVTSCRIYATAVDWRRFCPEGSIRATACSARRSGHDLPHSRSGNSSALDPSGFLEQRASQRTGYTPESCCGVELPSPPHQLLPLCTTRYTGTTSTRHPRWMSQAGCGQCCECSKLRERLCQPRQCSKSYNTVAKRTDLCRWPRALTRNPRCF